MQINSLFWVVDFPAFSTSYFFFQNKQNNDDYGTRCLCFHSEMKIKIHFNFLEFFYNKIYSRI